MKFITFLTAVLLSVRVSAAEQAPAPSYLTEPPPKTAKLNEVIKFKPKEGYHFNLEAPQECGAGEAFEVSTSSLKCQFTAGGEQFVSLKICEDKETVCLFEDFKVLVEGPAAAGPAAGTGLSEEEPALPGFLLNMPEAALGQAKREHKLLLVDFFGKWCPFCRIMEDTVLTQPAFLEASRNMVRVSLDVDKPAAREWLTRFRPAGYPTYLVADAELREIGRSFGGGLESFNAWLKEQETWKAQPIADARAKAASLDEAGKLRVAQAYMDEKSWDKARELLAGLKTRTALYLDAVARIKGAEDKKDAGLPALYREMIGRFDGSDGTEAEGSVMDWIAALHNLEPAAAKLYLDDLEAYIGRLKTSKEAAREGYAGPDIFVGLAEAMDGAGLPEKARAFYIRAAGAYAELAEKAAPGAAKGLRMGQARYLSRVKLYDKAAAVYGDLVKKFPGEYAFHRSYAGLLSELKKYPEALREASLASDLSYGNIHLDIALMKAQIEMKQKNKAAALKTLDDAIASVELPADSKLGTHGSYRRLKEYRKEVEVSK